MRRPLPRSRNERSIQERHTRCSWERQAMHRRGFMRRWSFLALATVALAAGCGGSTSAAARETRAFAPSEYRIGVEDVLEIAVWKEPQLSTTAPVRPDGKVTVPVAGEIDAAGKTPKELEALLAQKLSARIA